MVFSLPPRYAPEGYLCLGITKKRNSGTLYNELNKRRFIRRTIYMRTTFMAKGHEVERKWLVVDAEGQTLGRLASEVASILRGKHKPTFTPHVDTNDHVIIINAEKIHLTGKKLTDKIYYRHTQFTGGLKQ